jgi:hypothetical protein
VVVRYSSSLEGTLRYTTTAVNNFGRAIDFASDSAAVPVRPLTSRRPSYLGQKRNFQRKKREINSEFFCRRRQKTAGNYFCANKTLKIVCVRFAWRGFHHCLLLVRTQLRGLSLSLSLDPIFLVHGEEDKCNHRLGALDPTLKAVRPKRGREKERRAGGSLNQS